MARRARKRPVAVAVEFASRAGLLKTLEGPVRYRTDDALLTGAAGERWPVERAKFDAAYELVPPATGGNFGHYCKRPLTVWARQMSEPFSVRVGYAADALRGQPGDWLLQYASDDYGIISAALFAQTYELGDDTMPGTPASE
jgi:hypothetical protein